MGWDRGGISVVHQTPNREVLSSIRTGSGYYLVSLINLKKKHENKHKANNQGLRNFKVVKTQIKYDNYTKLKRKQTIYMT